MLYKRENGRWYSVRVGKKIASFLPPYIHKFWTQNLSVAHRFLFFSFFNWLKSSQNGLKHAPLNTQNITAMTFQRADFWVLMACLFCSIFHVLGVKTFRIDQNCNILISHRAHSLEHLGVARKLIGNALPISARVGEVDLAVNLGYIAWLMP